MGTDVYLEWEGKTEQEQKAQCTGWAIDAGGVGYLRACVSMTSENGVLRLLFPEKYWRGRSKDAYDFKGNFGQLSAIGWRYLVSVAQGMPFEIGKDQRAVLEEQQRMAATILQGLRNGAPEGAQVRVGALTELREAVAWLESLFSFFELGIAKQEQGQNPYPYISW